MISSEDFPYDNNVQTKKQLKKVLAQIFNKYGAEETAKIADRMKGQAFRFATIAAVSTGMTDYVHFDEIAEFVAEGDAKAALISEQFDQGLITEDERYNLTVNAWRNVDNKITAFLQNQLAHMDTDGVRRCLEILYIEMDTTMAFCGYTDIKKIDKKILVPGTY